MLHCSIPLRRVPRRAELHAYFRGQGGEGSCSRKENKALDARETRQMAGAEVPLRPLRPGAGSSNSLVEIVISHRSEEIAELSAAEFTEQFGGSPELACLKRRMPDRAFNVAEDLVEDLIVH